VTNSTGRKRYAMRDAEALLARLVEFAGAAEETTIGAQARRLLTDVLKLGPVLVIGDARHEVQNRPSGELTHLRGYLRAFYEGLLTLADSDAGGLMPTVQVQRLTFAATPVGSDVLITVDGDAADVLLFQSVQLMQVTGVGRLRRCPNCGRIFAKTGRREFCSDRCQKRIYMRNLRAREREKREKAKRKGRHSGKTTRTR
jgi:hypothetical protein